MLQLQNLPHVGLLIQNPDSRDIVTIFERVGSFFTVLIFQRGFLCGDNFTDRHLDKEFHLTDEQLQHFTTYNYTTRREGTSRESTNIK